MSETFVVTKQQKEQLTEFLEKVDKEIAPNKIPTKEAASILGLQNEDVDSSVSTYLASSGIEKLFYIINVIYLTTITTYISYMHSFFTGKVKFQKRGVQFDRYVLSKPEESQSSHQTWHPERTF